MSRVSSPPGRTASTSSESRETSIRGRTERTETLPSSRVSSWMATTVWISEWTSLEKPSATELRSWNGFPSSSQVLRYWIRTRSAAFAGNRSPPSKTSAPSPAIQEANGAHLHGYMSSSVRTTSMVLAALVDLDPKNEAIKPLVRVLMKQRRGADPWDTQENLYSLLALTSYARTSSAQTSSVTVEVGFKKPIFLPGSVSFGSVETADGFDFALSNPKSGAPHLLGRARQA